MKLSSSAGDRLRPGDLALALGVSLRTLEMAFRACVDLPPARYLRQRRMHRAHLRLVAADPADTNVTAVALDHGFTELGRFAVEYRRSFGESPSVTLRRAARRRRVGCDAE